MLHPPSNLHYGWQPSHVLGVPEPPSTNVWDPWKCPPTNHLGSPWAVGGGENLPKLERGQLFGPLKGGRWITAGDCSPIVGMPRYRSGSPIDTANHFDWLAPLGSASKNSSKLEFWALFPPTGPAKHASERTPFPPKLGHRTASQRGGGGVEGGEIVQNSNSGAFLAEGIYLNRRGSKMAMLLGGISIVPFLAPPLPRQRSATPHAGRW